MLNILCSRCFKVVFAQLYEVQKQKKRNKEINLSMDQLITRCKVTHDDCRLRRDISMRSDGNQLEMSSHFVDSLTYACAVALKSMSLSA